jgi:hypothetical protein
VSAVSSRLHELLAPLGFEGRKARWNRRSGSYIDVIDVQVSKAGDAVTVNAGVMDPDVYERCWGHDPPSFVDEPFCTVRARIGQLVDGRDRWYPIADAATPDILVAEVSENVVPFIERMHSREAMVEYLSASDVVRQKDPPSMIYLAILTHDAGDKASGCSLLAELQTAALGAWRTRAGEVSARLGCT